MPALIKHRERITDTWTLVEPGADPARQPLPASGDLIVPLALWHARRDELLARSPARLGLRLAPGDDPAAIAPDLEHFALVAIEFPKFADGRGYSSARLLRERHGYKGEVRAIGDVLHDHLPLMERCGFDAYALRDGQDPELALTAFNDFSEAYQVSVTQPVPLFRRRTQAGAAS